MMKGKIKMWECKIIDSSRLPDWLKVVDFKTHKLKEIIELPETKYKYWSSIGVVEGINHFRYEIKKNQCKTCGFIHKRKVREEW